MKVKNYKIDGMKVFSATKHAERQALDQKINAWLDANPNLLILKFIVTQSSDAQFHCLCITVVWGRELGSS